MSTRQWLGEIEDESELQTSKTLNKKYLNYDDSGLHSHPSKLWKRTLLSTSEPAFVKFTSWMPVNGRESTVSHLKELSKFRSLIKPRQQFYMPCQCIIGIISCPFSTNFITYSNFSNLIFNDDRTLGMTNTIWFIWY